MFNNYLQRIQKINKASLYNICQESYLQAATDHVFINNMLK